MINYYDIRITIDFETNKALRCSLLLLLNRATPRPPE